MPTPAPKVEDLMTEMSREQVLDLLLAILKGHGFPVGSWQSGSLELTTFQTFAELGQEFSMTTPQLAKAGFLPTSTGAWLDLLARSHYDEERLEGIKTLGRCTLEDVQGTGPHTFEAGEIVISDNVSGYRYRNTTGGTLALEAFDSFEFEAELIGHAQNVGNNTISVVLEGPPGITVTNPDSGSGTWITREGASEESDLSLIARCAAKWATLGPNGPKSAYEFWCRQANAAVTRVFVDDQNPRGPGTIDIYVAGAGGEVTSPVVDSVTAHLQGTVDGVGRRALSADVLVQTAVARELTISGTVYYQPNLKPEDVENAVTGALTRFFEELPVGGTKSFDEDEGELLVPMIYARMFSVAGVVNVADLVPAANVTLEPYQVVVPTFDFTYTAAVF